MSKHFKEVGGQGQPTATFGAFSVKYGERQEQEFTDYDRAKTFYDEVDSNASLWDVTIGAELCHSKQEVETRYRTILITLSGEDEQALKDVQREAISRLGQGFVDFFDRTWNAGYHLRVSDELQPPPASNRQVALWLSEVINSSSGEAILQRFLGEDAKQRGWFPYPTCISDFGRCYSVLRICQIDIAIMRGTTPEWDTLVAVWPQLEQYYEQWVKTGDNKSINVLPLARELASRL